MYKIQYILTAKAKELKEKAICDCTPVRGTPVSAGMDLKACIEKPVTIYPGSSIKVMTGVKVFLGTFPHDEQDEIFPMQLAGLYLPRSSQNGLILTNTVGLLDCDYQGESFVKWKNMGEEPVIIQPGERMVQLVIFPVMMLPWERVDSFTEWTERGEGGDGSTGCV
jgi:dUTP pyrophosphatase